MKSLPLLFSLLLSAGLLAFSGCETTQLPDPYDYTLQLDPSLQGASIQVDMIGVPAADLDKWRTKSVTAYWQPGDMDRSQAPKRTLVFSKDTPQSQTLPGTDRVWQTWIQDENAVSVVVLVDLPGLQQDAPGNADPRRLILPLASDAWDERPQFVTINISPSGVTASPAPLTDF